MILFAVGLVLCQHALASQASLLSHSYAGNDIEALCARKSVDLTTFSQLKQLGQAVEGSSCSSTIKEAIGELVQLIASGKDDLCSENSITALKTYYGKYLDTSGSLGDKHKQLLPKSLKRFALAYGMQMSNACKKNMINVLSSEGRHLVGASDFKQLEMAIGDDGPVAQVLAAMSNPGEVFLPGDLVPFLKKHGVESDDHFGGSDPLIMQTAASDYIKKMQAVCQHRFKPVYEPLMMPLVRLVNMGFDYKDEPLRCDLRCPKIVRDIGQWSRVVFLCEALANLRLVEEKRDAEQAEGCSSMQVRIMTKEEADAIESTRSPVESEQATSMDVVYTPHHKVTLADEIYDKADKQLKKAIKSFKTDRNEEYIMRQRVTRKGYELIRKQLKRGHFGFILSAAWKGRMLKRSGRAVKSPTKEVVETINGMIERQQEGVASDGPVSEEGSCFNVVVELIMIVILSAIMAALVVGFMAATHTLG